MRPITLPPPFHWATRPHGTRLRYISGCKCVACRAAHSRYNTWCALRQAQGFANGIVDAAPALAHVRELGRHGMGYKRVARAAGVSPTTVQLIMVGKRTQMRALNVKKICAVRLDLAPHALVPAAPTWALLEVLVADGYPKVRLAHWLGQRGQGLQISHRYVTVRTMKLVRRLFAWLCPWRCQVALHA